MATLITCDYCGDNQKAVSKVSAYKKDGNEVSPIESYDTCLVHVGIGSAELFADHYCDKNFYDVVVVNIAEFKS